MKHIMVITGSRGEYGYIKPILKLFKKNSIKYSLIVTNMHLLQNFGSSVDFFKEDDLDISHEIFMALDGYTSTSMVKSLGVFLLSITDILHNNRPDLVLISGDRGEQLMAAIAAAHMNIPVAHIQAGEISGNIDGQTRHAIARYSHLHFASNEDAYNRLIKSGEQKFRVFNVGAPQLDDFINGEIAEEQEVLDYFHLEKNKPIVLFVQHPVTEQFSEAYEQMKITLQALSEFKFQTVLIYPNNDAGCQLIQKALNEYKFNWIKLHRNVKRSLYGGLMKISNFMIGNSSSGLLEAPSFELPAINIGRRQEGRFQGKNVINCDFDKEEIVKCIKIVNNPDFKKLLKGMENPYGNGKSSQKIIDIILNLKLNEELLFKKITI